MMKIVTHNARETQQLAKQILKYLPNINLIVLYGDLGSGKTTFVQGLAKILGSSDRVLSPTFVLQRSYKLNSPYYKIMHHLDLYRLKNADDLKSINLSELTAEPESLVIIEWAEKIKGTLPSNHLSIKFKITGNQQRTITI